LTTTDFSIKEAYTKFKESIDLRLTSIDLDIDGLTVRANYIANQLCHVGTIYELRNDLYIVVKDYKENEVIPTLEYLEDVNYKNLHSEEWFISKNPIITNYFKSFVDILISIYNLNNIKKLYESCNIDYQTYYRLITTYYNNVANSLLKGEVYILFGIGRLNVICRRNTLSKTTKYKVDWGESLKVLKEFAKNHYPAIYKDYIDKIINKASFISSLKPYLYDEKNNINGFKWLVHLHKDYSAWLVFTNKKINWNYNIVPSNFVMNETRSQVDFTNNITSINDIYNSNQLGFRDKLNCLLRYDFNYINKFPNL